MSASEENLRKVLGLPSEDEKAAASEAFQQKLFEIFAASLPDTSTQNFIRAIVECESWFVPLKPDNSFETIEAKKGKYRTAIDPHNEQTSKNKWGAGGRLLPIYDSAPGRLSVTLDGRALSRALTTDFDGLLIHQNEESPRELEREYFADLKSVAISCDFEDLLACPAPGQSEALLRATWLVPMEKNRLLLDRGSGEDHVVEVFTHPDRVRYDLQKCIVPMTGEELSRHVVADEGCDGVVVNPLHRIGRGAHAIRNPVYAPVVFYRWLEGHDARVGVEPLVARHRREIEWWLQMRAFPLCYGEIVEETRDGSTRLQARTTRYVSGWRMQESRASQEELVWPVCSPEFFIEKFPDDEPSRILCPGWLARELHADACNGKDAARYWNKGISLGFGRYVNATWRTLSEWRLERAVELAKFLPPGENIVPREALKTVQGAAFLRSHRHAATRAWIEETARQAKRHTKAWVGRN